MWQISGNVSDQSVSNTTVQYHSRSLLMMPSPVSASFHDFEYSAEKDEFSNLEAALNDLKAEFNKKDEAMAVLQKKLQVLLQESEIRAKFWEEEATRPRDAMESVGKTLDTGVSNAI
jgi:hypothetical protein